MTKNWCESFFDDLFADQHMEAVDAREVEATRAFFVDKLKLKPNDLVFDQCCGVGAFSHALAEKGYRAIGIDLIPSYIERAKRKFQDVCRFAVADAYEYETPELCDAAINWWTSFGYTSDDAQNAEMLHRVHASLKPGAWFVLDYMNAPQRLAELSDGRVAVSETQQGNTRIIWESRLDTDTNMVVKKWTCIGADGQKVEKQGGGVKIYTQDELAQMFTQSGFTDISFYGDVAGNPVTEGSRRCIVVAQKAG